MPDSHLMVAVVCGKTRRRLRWSAKRFAVDFRSKLSQSTMSQRTAKESFSLKMRCSKRQRAAALLLLLSRQKKRRKYWVRPAIARRAIKGEFCNLVIELEKEDNEWFHKYMRMDCQAYRALVGLVKPYLQKK
jgi:hypothetical protein